MLALFDQLSDDIRMINVPRILLKSITLSTRSTYNVSPKKLSHFYNKLYHTHIISGAKYCKDFMENLHKLLIRYNIFVLLPHFVVDLYLPLANV